MEKYIVYVQTDENQNIIAVNSSAFVSDLEGWVQIDQGTGDKYFHAQANYFDKPVSTEEGVAKYKLVEGKAVERTQEEIDVDRLPILKENKVSEIEAALTFFLENNPMQWTDGKHYEITPTAQQQLTSKILTASMAGLKKESYDLTWNSVENGCESWTIDNLSALGFGIDNYVTALVTYEKTKIQEVKEAQNIGQLNEITVDYSQVQS